MDVILSDNAPPVLRAAGAIQPYETVQKDFLLIHDPTIPVVSLQIQALAYNTRKLKEPDLPKDWEDVANPKYKGLVALDDPMRAGPMSTQLAAFKELWKNDERWTKFVKGLKALNVPLHKSTSALFRLVIAGEYGIAMPALLHDVMHEKGQGTPVDFVKGAPLPDALRAANLAAAGDVLAEQRSMTELTGRPARSDYLGASGHLVDAVLQRARRHLKEAT